MRVHILRAELDDQVVTERITGLPQGGERRANDDFHLRLVLIADFHQQRFQVGLRFPGGEVHLPVGGDDEFAHDVGNC